MPIILTDFDRFCLITSLNDSHGAASGELITCEAHTLRDLLVGHVMSSLDDGHFDLHPDEFFRPQGALNDPSIPAPSDEDIFATRHGHADFDRFLLTESPEAFAQFGRWKDRMRARQPVSMTNTVLIAQTDGFAACRMPFEPRYPLEPLPESTEAHLHTIKRVTFPLFAQMLEKSNSFHLSLEKELTPINGLGYARTFVCTLTQIDGREVTGNATALYDESSFSS